MSDTLPKKPDLSTHPAVAKLLGDSDTPPNLVILTGFLGPSKKADWVRLYARLDFQSYFEIPKAAIVATTPVDPDDDQSATVVHVQAGTPVAAVQTSTQPVESYLQGGITGGYLAAAAQALVGHPINMYASPYCASCECPSAGCPSAGCGSMYFCQSGNPQCGVGCWHTGPMPQFAVAVTHPSLCCTGHLCASRAGACQSNLPHQPC